LNQQAKVQSHELSTEELNDLIIESIQDRKGKNLIKMDLRGLEDAPTDFFIICEGDSFTQVKAIADNVATTLKNQGGTLPVHIEGQRNAQWICIDYFHTVVHVFHPEKRDFYELESLWSDASTTEYESL